MKDIEEFDWIMWEPFVFSFFLVLKKQLLRMYAANVSKYVIFIFTE